MLDPGLVSDPPLAWQVAQVSVYLKEEGGGGGSKMFWITGMVETICLHNCILI